MPAPNHLRWIAFAIVAAVPMIYVGAELGWSIATIAAVLGWGAITAGITAELARRGL